MGAEVLNLSIRTSINISGLSNICASISPTSPSAGTLVVIESHTQESNPIFTLATLRTKQINIPCIFLRANFKLISLAAYNNNVNIRIKL